MIGCLLFNLFSMVISVPTTSSVCVVFIESCSSQQIEDLGIVHMYWSNWFQNLSGNDLYYERNAAADPSSGKNTYLYGDIVYQCIRSRNEMLSYFSWCHKTPMFV